MTCDDVRAALVDFLGGELAVEYRETVDVHIRGCARCGVYVATYTCTVRIARALPKRAPLPPAFEARLRKALGPEFGGGDEPTS